MESDPRLGRPATSRTPENVGRVWAGINKDQRPTVQELEADLGIPKTTTSEFLTQALGMKRGKIRSRVSATGAEGTLCCRCSC